LIASRLLHHPRLHCAIPPGGLSPDGHALDPYATGPLSAVKVPLEVYELVRQVTPLRTLILLANVAIVVYVYLRKEQFQ
jgi:hypothetical protein